MSDLAEIFACSGDVAVKLKWNSAYEQPCAPVRASDACQNCGGSGHTESFIIAKHGVYMRSAECSGCGGSGRKQPR